MSKWQYEIFLKNFSFDITPLSLPVNCLNPKHNEQSAQIFVNNTTSLSFMIKRAGSIIILLLLLVSTGGIPITWHYCGSRAMSFSVYSTPKPCCKSPCDKCHNVFRFYKVNTEFEPGSLLTALSFRDIITLKASFVVKLLDNYLTSFRPVLFNKQADLNHRADDSPASAGNLRCWNPLSRRQSFFVAQ